MSTFSKFRTILADPPWQPPLMGKRNRVKIDQESISNKRNPGYCFKVAGWQFVKKSSSGLHLLEKMELGT